MSDQEIGYITQSCRRCPRASEVVAAVLANSTSSVLGRTANIRTEGSTVVTRAAQDDNRYVQGLRALKEVGGERFDDVIKSLRDIALDPGALHR